MAALNSISPSKLVAALCLSLFVTGCATRQGPQNKPTAAKPAPTQQEDQGSAVVSAYIPPSNPSYGGQAKPISGSGGQEAPTTPGYGQYEADSGYVRPEPSKAVAALSTRADDQRAAGDLNAASSSLERALRIEPNNPVLWNRLARVRLEQKQYEQATQMAKRSNSFAAADDAGLRRDNQDIINAATQR